MNVTKKSPVIAFFLALFFGPLGMLYSNVVAAIILGVIAVLTAASIFIPLVCWVLSIPISLYCVYDHNENVDKTIRILQSSKQS